jgi:hypothetical protein
MVDKFDWSYKKILVIEDEKIISIKLVNLLVVLKKYTDVN